MSRAVFFISEAFRALRRSAAPSIAAIVTIVVTTLLLGVLIPVLKASGDKAQDVRDQIGLNVFLYNDAARGEIDALGAELEALPHVESVDYVSRKEARRDPRRPRRGRALKDSLDELNSNPLPPSFAIDIDSPTNLGAVTPRSPRRARPATASRSARSSTRSATPARTPEDHPRDRRGEGRARRPRGAAADRLADARRQHDPPLDLRASA